MKTKTTFEQAKDIWNKHGNMKPTTLCKNDTKWVKLCDMISLFEDDSITCFDDLAELVLELKEK